ncbi:L-galactonate transporter [Serratia rubidaea]|uniref:L-galactonate transporter n=1 Tax=Serratia rubidaea TaxID=61652 RepID=A0A4U9HBF7_SERRU|nr:L-galactonate transporter [Serratia rubidaea]
MEKTHTAPRPTAAEPDAADTIVPMPPDGALVRSARLKKIQTTAMLLLFLAAIIKLSRPQFAVGRQLHHPR